MRGKKNTASRPAAVESNSSGSKTRSTVVGEVYNKNAEDYRGNDQPGISPAAEWFLAVIALYPRRNAMRELTAKATCMLQVS